jgi:hypothetical protein
VGIVDESVDVGHDGLHVVRVGNNVALHVDHQQRSVRTVGQCTRVVLLVRHSSSIAVRHVRFTALDRSRGSICESAARQ